jgi:sodium/potassium-transporting ATPase subunit alpha
MQIHGLDTEAALASLNTTAAGLSVPEALRRRAEFGPNQVEELGRKSVLLSFYREFTHFFAIILWVGAALAIVSDHFDPGQRMSRVGVSRRLNLEDAHCPALRHRDLSDRWR